MHQRVIHVYTHDSIGLGEDGPTHQPIEHLASLRAMPNLSTLAPLRRRRDGRGAGGRRRNEPNGPTALILTRQALPQQPRTDAQKANIAKGGYVLIDSTGGAPQAIVIATGSEVGIAAEAVKKLNSAGKRVRLVSMPSTEAFDAQDAAYRESRAAARR